MNLVTARSTSGLTIFFLKSLEDVVISFPRDVVIMFTVVVWSDSNGSQEGGGGKGSVKETRLCWEMEDLNRPKL